MIPMSTSSTVHDVMLAKSLPATAMYTMNIKPTITRGNRQSL